MLGMNIENIVLTVLSALPFCFADVSPDVQWRSVPKAGVEGQHQAVRAPPATSLYYQEKRAELIRSHCDSHLALYMGRWILITKTFFEDSVVPLQYVGSDVLNGSVSSAAFVLDHLTVVINGKLYIYSLSEETWTPAQGVTSTVSTVTSLQCCFSRDKACLEVSSAVLVYNMGSPMEDNQVFLSLNGGFSFFQLLMAAKPNEFIGGIFNMPTVSSTVAMIINDQNKFSFRYMSSVEHQLQTDEQPMTDPLSSIRVVQPAGMRGHVILWSPHMLLYSPNHGVVIISVYVIGENEKVALPPLNVTISQVATDANGVIAVLTSDGMLYYGRVGLEAVTVKFSSVLDMTKENLMLFSDYGDLTLIEAREDLLFSRVDFDHTGIIVQQELTRTSPPVPSCPVEQFHSTFAGQLYYIDMGSQVHLSAVYIPSRLCTFFPLVTVTDSKVLSAEAKIVENGITPEGTKKYRLEIELQQLAFTLAEDGTVKPSPRKGSLSTVTVDLMGRDVSCKDLNPLKAHILIGCPPGKHIRILRNISACTKGTFSQEQLQDYSYTISRNVYDPEHQFRPDSASSDLHLSYSITDFFCPLLVYHDVPWIPIVELWNGPEFVEYVSADFVLFEVNGMYNYQYHQSALGAKCVSQPQNWTSQLGKQRRPDPNTAWTRNNYKSCRDSDGPPLTDPSAQYQVLNMGQGNKVVFPNYNGIYIFKVIVMDPSYSYCELSTTFSVYVYGAFPPHPLASGVALGIFLSIFVVLLLIGFFLSQHAHKK